MKPYNTLAETRTPDGGRLTLVEHDGDYAIRLNGHGLMDSRATASETLLGTLGGIRAPGSTRPRYLVGGLGMGFTLRSLLAKVVARAEVHVAELIPAVVEWNREFLLQSNGALLDDPRVEVIIDDVWHVLGRAQPESYDAILLDIDNGPYPLVQASNLRMYYRRGIELVSRAVKPGGRAAIWSAGRDQDFCRRLGKAGFSVETVTAKQHNGAKQHTCFIYVANKA